MSSPSEKLAERILNRLVQEKLLSKQEAKKLAPKLPEGRVRSEDWRLAVEVSNTPKAKP
jgi:hypothetical protein